MHGWDFIRLTILLVSASNIGAMVAIVRIYSRRARNAPWYSRLLPQHVWRVAAGSVVLMFAASVRAIGRLGDDPSLYAPVVLVGNVLFLRGLIFMLRYMNQRG